METSPEIHWSSALQGLKDSEVQHIERYLTWRDVPSRSPIFQQGDQADALYIVHTGRVRLIMRTKTGEEFTSGVWGEGYLIGLISAFLGARRFLAAETLEPATLRSLPRNALHSCMEAIPTFAFNIANLLALLASDSIQRAAPLILDSVETKLGRALVKLAVLDDDAQSYVVRNITQEELSTMVGASRPWVNHALAALEKRGLIQRHKQMISIVDMATCRKLWIE